jgi:hypothetical protein
LERRQEIHFRPTAHARIGYRLGDDTSSTQPLDAIKTPKKGREKYSLMLPVGAAFRIGIAELKQA